MPARKHQPGCPKPCTKCGLVKPLSEFYLQYPKGNYHNPRCKSCCLRVAAKRRREHKDKERARARKFHQNHVEQRYQYRLRQIREKPEIEAAQRAVLKAIKRGDLIRPEVCDNCSGRLGGKRVVGHHFMGYDFPLLVVWLCDPCHKEAHGQTKHVF